MKVIFAQGNPGSQYAKTRHNVGFIFANLIAKEWGVSFVKKPKFQADIAEISINGEKILIVKPTTYYNETGQSARLLVDFYKLDPTKDFVVVHDDLSLPLGTIRTREQGRDAGNNGIKSLNAHIGIQHKRIRIGIYNDLRDRVHDADFVLGVFNSTEAKVLLQVFERVEYFVATFIADRFESTKVSIPAEPAE
jgi:PTH1 family peptidyl-tRNA hydrolase